MVDHDAPTIPAPPDVPRTTDLGPASFHDHTKVIVRVELTRDFAHIMTRDRRIDMRVATNDIKHRFAHGPGVAFFIAYVREGHNVLEIDEEVRTW